ncbi:hypothetical protein B0H13DRAFT_1877436 [Mycena leptocephala]|nr:hypothetical protein B0H13DRAFT_1877436 [Mycena leptocephala]
MNTLAHASVLGSRAFNYTIPRHLLSHANESALCDACIDFIPAQSIQGLTWKPTPAGISPESGFQSLNFSAARKGTEAFRFQVCVHVSKEDPSPNLASAFEANSSIRFAGALIQLSKAQSGAGRGASRFDFASRRHGMSVRSCSERARCNALSGPLMVCVRMSIASMVHWEGQSQCGEFSGGGGDGTLEAARECTSTVRELGWRQAARWYTIACHIDKGGSYWPSCRTRYRLRDRKMRKEKWGKEEVTHWIDEHHCVDSALGWGAETSGTSCESEVHVEANGVLAGAGVTGRHSSRSG